MMKANRKLVLRRESLRTLASLDLVHVAGGADPGTIQLGDSGDAACRTKGATLNSNDALGT
jgi:hypothetical protein